ncbi:MAG: hypothetical protein AAEJ43_04840, partial [Gammaproteobacteria bacterium]
LRQDDTALLLLVSSFSNLSDLGNLLRRWDSSLRGAMVLFSASPRFTPAGLSRKFVPDEFFVK